jgi:hypothetical protein
VRQDVTALQLVSWLSAVLLAGGAAAAAKPAGPRVGRYRVFEASVENHRPYANRFADVQLHCTYSAPSGKTIEFTGFFDGDGHGGGDARTGHVWKLRFMPDELGEWRYRWSWSDGTEGGAGSFTAVSEGAGRGVLRAYERNPRWFAYNGRDPVWIKSYYETGHASIAQPFEWIAANVYQPLLDRGYNHLQVNWLLSLCCFRQYYKDGPPPSTRDLTLYQEGRASSTMRLDVWQMMERHLGWLNDRDVGVHMFLGFEGRKNGGPKWEALSEDEKDFYVRYVVARIGPYANLAGWNFVWEDPGHRESHELGLARLLRKHDVFGHLRTYQDESPRENEYARPEYTFAAIENHGIAAPERSQDVLYRKVPWTHHQAALVGSVTGKPVYMSEGNALWRRYWHQRSGATQDDLRRAAWGVVTAAASFGWNGHAGEEGLFVRGPEGMPFHGDDNPYVVSAKAVDVVSEVMTHEVAFHRMTPHDFALTHHDPLRVWCLAEPGRQYLTFATAGEAFTLHLAAGEYVRNVWIDTRTGRRLSAPETRVSAGEVSTGEAELVPEARRVGTKATPFTPPDRESDWVLLLRTSEK